MRWGPNKVSIALILFLASRAAMAQSDKPSNTMGAVTNNQGIVTQGQVGNNTIVNPIRRDANGIYQGDKKIGDAPAPSIENGIAFFQSFHLSNYPDLSQPIEYGNLLLSPEGLPQPRPNTYIGMLSIMIAGWKTKVVGAR
jgi:hypothetical protein